MFIVALFTIAKTWNLSKCPLNGKWIKKMCPINTMDEYSTSEKQEILPLATTWIILRPLLLLLLLLSRLSRVRLSVRPHRRQPTRLPHPWDSPGKNTGVGCHFFLQCMKVKKESEVAQLCPTLSNPMDRSSLPGSSVHGIFQARVLEWNAIAFFIRPLC